MILIKNNQKKIKVNVGRLKKQLEAMLDQLGYAGFDVGLWLTTNATIKKFNKTYRSKDKPTDILSFPYHTDLEPGEKITVREPEDKNLGDMLISLEFVKVDAPKRWDRTFEEQMTVLLAHGLAHLLNYDHQTDEEFEVMQKVERKLLRAVKGL